MNIYLSGSNGLVGTAVKKAFEAEGHSVTGLGRDFSKPLDFQGAIGLAQIKKLDHIISLRQKLRHWESFFYGHSPVEPTFNGYSPTAWMQVVQGLDIFPSTYFTQAFADKLDIDKNVLNTNVKRYKKLVAPFWTIDEWIENIDK